MLFYFAQKKPLIAAFLIIVMLAGCALQYGNSCGSFASL